MSALAVRKWQQLGPGIEIFGVTLVLAARKLKCSSIGWSAGKSSLPLMVGKIGADARAVEWTPSRVALDDLEAVERRP